MQRARVDVLLALVLVALPTTACGNDPAASGDGPGARHQVSEADQACRDRWHDLGSAVATQAARGGMVKQVFASRWDSIAAGVAYYESTATSDQCDKEIDTEKQTISSLRALVDKVLPFDMEARFAEARAGRAEFAASHPDAKEPAKVRTAYRTMRTFYAPADEAIAPAVVQLADTEPTDTPAIRQRMRDLVLLAQTSDVWQVCKAALRTIHAYEHPKPKDDEKPGKSSGGSPG